MQPKPNLDLLRTIAVTLVVADHFMQARGFERFMQSMGLFGVYLFFVHTCLVLMWSLERRPNVLDFYVRRAFRIYPLAILTILLAALTHAPVAGQLGDFFRVEPVTAKALIANCLLISELLRNAPLIHGVTWSLGPEVFMYLLLPALFFYSRSQKKVWPLLVLWLFTVAEASRLMDQMGHANTFYLLVPDFLSGVIAYVGFSRWRAFLPASFFFALLAVLGAVAIGLGRHRADWPVCLVLGLAMPYFRQFGSPSLMKVSHTIATYSYGIYLIHPFSLALAFYLLPHASLWLQSLIFFSSLASGSFLSYHLVEKPMIELGARVAARWAHERGAPSERDLASLKPAP